MTTANPPAKRRSYDDVEITAALTTLAASGENYRHASEVHDISETTIRSWFRQPRWRDEYPRIQTEMAPEVRRQASAHAKARASEWNELERKVIQKAAEKLDNSPHITARDLVSMGKEAAFAKKANIIDIAAPLDGQPTAIVEHRDATEILQQLTKSLGITIDSTAEEIPTLDAAKPNA